MKGKPLLFVLLFLFSSLLTTAQLRLPAINILRADVQKVVAHFPNNLQALCGAVVASNPQSTEYTSLVALEKAETCTITKYSSTQRAVYSWQALMLTTEDFAEAAKKYRWLFHQLKGMNVKHVTDQYTLTGAFEVPEESLKFTTSQLSVASAPMPLKKLKIEVAINFEFPEWKVLLTVFEKEKEDEEGGSVMEN